MRARLCCLIGAGLVVLTGCGDNRPPEVPAGQPPAAIDLPAASAGGACALLDFPVIEQTTGTHFDVSAASRAKDTQSCVVRSEQLDYPDLTLSVTDTSADVSIFKADVVPSGAKSVSGLGKAAYRLTAGPQKGAGPAAEVGWLSDDGRLIVLRYAFASGQDRAAADGLGEKLVDLAKKIDADKI